jgi:CheY-like chemotaxis protein
MARSTNHPQKLLRALVLDADASSLRALTRSLEARSFSVVTATDGARGLDLLLDEMLSLDVLVVDAALPHRDAAAFAELVRRAGGERDLAFVAITRDASPDYRAVLLARGSTPSWSGARGRRPPRPPRSRPSRRAARARSTPTLQRLRRSRPVR